MRLSVGIPILYILEVIIQEGLNPIKNPAPILWLVIPIVILGSSLLAIGGLNSRNSLWQNILGDLSNKALVNGFRSLAGFVGWVMVLTPNIFLVLDSINRLQNFQTPPIKWIN